MRLQNYVITEDYDKEIKQRYVNISLIWKNCQPFLKEVIKIKSSVSSDSFLFSGRQGHGYGVDPFYKADVRQNRQPRDSNLTFHKDMDDALEKYHGVRGRSNSLFVTGNPYEASEYGKIYLIFPIGNYKILYSPKIEDFTTWLSRQSVFPDKLRSLKNQKLIKYRSFEEMQVDYESLLDNISKTYKKTTNIGEFNKEQVEGMLLCKSYYAAFGNKYTTLIFTIISRYKDKMPTFEQFKEEWDRLSVYTDLG